MQIDQFKNYFMELEVINPTERPININPKTIIAHHRYLTQEDVHTSNVRYSEDTWLSALFIWSNSWSPPTQFPISFKSTLGLLQVDLLWI